jgi:glycosyltransferase involved in cell wall biosynthesis
VRTKNAVNLLSLDLVDAGVSPTFFQYETYPEAYRYKLSVIFDGVDTSRCHPDPDARLALADGGELTTDDEVVTFCTRAYEEQRGFTTFMRAVAELQRQRPNLHAVIVGGQGNPYGDRANAGEALKDRLVAETGVDLARTHFLGNVPWSRLQTVFRVSSVHIYLTVPFVLSWSLMEAMASACAVVASDTAPVREVIEDGVNGRLADFHAPAAFVARCNAILDAPDRAADLRRRARATVLARYDLQLCLKRQVALIERLVAGERPTPPRPVHHPGAPAFMPPSRLDAPET